MFYNNQCVSKLAKIFDLQDYIKLAYDVTR